MKLMTVIGCRPNFVKVDRRLKQILVHTGQHYDPRLKDVFFKGLKIPRPKYDLHEPELGAMIDKLMVVMRKEQPTHVLVYGDTNSTLAGALAAKQCKAKLIHVEAGMRSGNMEMLEEQNRIMIDHISDFLLCPSIKEMNRLQDEKVSGMIGVCGNVALDTCYEQLPTKKNKNGKYLLMTLHRAETVDDKAKLEEIFEALAEVDYRIIFPMHPRTAKRIADFGIKLSKNVEVIKPVPYKEMVNLTAHAYKVLTDSGGLQVEAHFLTTPCITLRTETEWTETVNQGWNVLVGHDKDSIIKAITAPRELKHRELCYGAGDAKDKIKSFIESL